MATVTDLIGSENTMTDFSMDSSSVTDISSEEVSVSDKVGSEISEKDKTLDNSIAYDCSFCILVSFFLNIGYSAFHVYSTLAWLTYRLLIL